MLPNSTNIYEQINSYLDNLSKMIDKSIISKRNFTAKVKIYRNNLDDIKIICNGIYSILENTDRIYRRFGKQLTKFSEEKGFVHSISVLLFQYSRVLDKDTVKSMVRGSKLITKIKWKNIFTSISKALFWIKMLKVSSVVLLQSIFKLKLISVVLKHLESGIVKPMLKIGLLCLIGWPVLLLAGKIVPFIVDSIRRIVSSIGRIKGKDIVAAMIYSTLIKTLIKSIILIIGVIILAAVVFHSKIIIGLTMLMLAITSILLVVRVLSSKSLQKDAKNGSINTLAIAAIILSITFLIVGIMNLDTNANFAIKIATLLIVIAAALVIVRILSKKSIKKRTKDAIATTLSLITIISLLTTVLLNIGATGDAEHMLSGIARFILAVAISIGLIIWLSKKKFKTTVKDSLKHVAGISVIFDALAKSLSTISNVSKNSLKDVSVFILCVSLSVGVLMWLSGRKISTNIKKSAKNVLYIMASFATLALVLILMSNIAKDPSVFIGYGILLLCISASVSLILFLGSKFLNRTAKNAGLNVLIISTAFIVFVLAILLASEVAVKENLWKGIILLAGLILMTIGVLLVMNIMKKAVNYGIRALMFVCLAYLTFVTTLFLLSEITVDGNLMKSLGVLVLLVGIAVGVILVLNMAKKAILKGAITLLLVIVTYYALVGVMTLINKLVEESPNIWINTLIFTGLITLLTGIVVAAGFAIGFIAAGAGALLLLAGSLLLTAIAFRKIDEVSKECDIEQTGKNIATILTVMAKGFVEAGKELKGHFMDATKVVLLSTGMSNAITKISEAVANMANLTVTEYDERGRVIGTRHLTEQDFKLAAEGTCKVVTAMINAILPLANDTEVKEMLKGGGFLGLGKSTAAKILNITSTMGTAISSIVDVIADIGHGKFKNSNGEYVDVDFELVRGNITKLISSCIGGVSDVSDKMDDKVINNLSKTAKTVDSLTTAVNKVDVTKLDKMNNLLTTLHKFTQGVEISFDSLAATINGNLVKTLEDLKEVLENVTTTLESTKDTIKSSASSSGSIGGEAASSGGASGGTSSDGKTPDGKTPDGKTPKAADSNDPVAIAKQIKTLVNNINNVINNMKNSSVNVNVTNDPLIVKTVR